MDVSGVNLTLSKWWTAEMFLEYYLSQPLDCWRQEEPALVLISRLLLRMRYTYVANIQLDFH